MLFLSHQRKNEKNKQKKHPKTVSTYDESQDKETQSKPQTDSRGEPQVQKEGDEEQHDDDQAIASEHGPVKILSGNSRWVFLDKFFSFHMSVKMH